MRWFEWAFLATVIVYIGNILGCMILCETIPQIESVRKYTWMIPVLNLMLFFSFLSEALGGQEFAPFWKFIKMPQKNIFALSVMAGTLKEEITEEHQYRCFLDRKGLQKKCAAVFKGTLRSLAALLNF